MGNMPKWTKQEDKWKRIITTPYQEQLKNVLNVFSVRFGLKMGLFDCCTNMNWLLSWPEEYCSELYQPFIYRWLQILKINSKKYNTIIKWL